jgi:Tfp pilus assembly protein PilO
MRILLPFILLAASLGLFFGYVNPTYTGAKAIAAENDSYNSALDTAKSLVQQRDQLLAKRQTFSADDIQKLQRLLPDNVDNIRLIIDINNIAARHNLTLKNVVLGSVSSASAPRSDTAVGSSGDPVGSVELGFAVTASYDNFRAFLADLEHSLRILDVEKLEFKNAAATDSNDYTFTIRTYWLH